MTTLPKVNHPAVVSTLYDSTFPSSRGTMSANVDDNVEKKDKEVDIIVDNNNIRNKIKNLIFTIKSFKKYTSNNNIEIKILTKCIHEANTETTIKYLSFLYIRNLNPNNNNIKAIINLKGQSIKRNNKTDGIIKPSTQYILFEKIFITEINEYKKIHLIIPVYNQKSIPNLYAHAVIILYNI